MLNRFTAPWLDGSNYPVDWNGPAARPCGRFADADLSTPIFTHFEAAARTHADAVAIDDGTRRLTYRETHEAAVALAHRLAAATQADDLIGILLPSSVDFPIAMLACLAAGRRFVPLDAHYPRAWLAGVIGDAGMGAVVSRFDDADIASLVPPGILRIDLSETARVEICGLAPAPADAPALVLFTSGSTGKPKGIVNSQRALLRRVQQYVQASHIDATDRFLPLSSECTIAGLRERLTALLTGATLHLVDVQRAGARALLDRLRDDAITMVYGVPALLRTLIQLGDGPSALRNLRIGGDAVLWSDIDALRAWLPKDCRIQLGYSSTEAPILQWFVPPDFPREGPRVPLGYPLAGNALAIIGADGAPVAPGEEGELVVRSSYVALGRWTAGAVDGTEVPADPNDPSRRIHATGDLVRLRADGMIDLIGRKDRQIKIRGRRVEPGELEAALRRQPNIQDAAVFPRRVGAAWWLIAYIVGDIDMTRLKTSLREALPAALQPQRIHRIDTVPRLASAKLDMQTLAARDEEFRQREATGETARSAAPIGETEATVARLLCQVLERDWVGRDDDFFDLGGDSISTLDLIFALEEEFGIELPVTIVYDAPTVASLAAIVEHRGAVVFSPLVKIKDGEDVPLLIVHGIGGNVMELFAAGRRVAGGPVYALQARGLDGRQTPSTSVEEMADDYITEFLKAFPHGTCHLAGYSSGGLIAFEMACRLAEAGEPPASLTLIDSQTNARQWPLDVWAAFLLGRAGAHMRAALDLPAGQILSYAGGALASFGRRILWRLGHGEPPALELPERLPPALQAVFDANFAAVSAYRPPRYDGAVTLIVPEQGDPQRPDPVRIWRKLCRRLVVRRVPGNHRSMVKGPNAAVLAAAISDVYG